MIVGKQRESPL